MTVEPDSPPRPRILIADDDRFSVKMLEARLRGWGYEVVVCRDGEEAAASLCSPEGPSLAILDWEMPGLNGLEVVDQVRTQRKATYTYIVLLTGRSAEDDIASGLDAGADDFMTKPLRPVELRSRLRAGERILALQSELLSARDRLRHEATHDPLTGILNRGAIIDDLRHRLGMASTGQEVVAVVLFDLDHFKRINDTFGHLVGDDVLIETARRATASLRSGDCFGRYGGEEFLVVLPRVATPEAARVAERIRAGLASEPMLSRDGPVLVTGSFGVATWRAADGTNADDLIARADAALYEAKRTGRNRVVISGGRPTAAPSLSPRRRGGRARSSLAPPRFGTGAAGVRVSRYP